LINAVRHLLKVLTLELKSNDFNTNSVRDLSLRGVFLEQVSAVCFGWYQQKFCYLLRLGLFLLRVDVEDAELALLLLDRASKPVDLVGGSLGR
jgi:hypothetical protein